MESSPSANLYTQELSLHDEMPRLTAQANLFKLLLDPYFDSIHLDTFSGEGLDAGAGPGVLTGLLMKKNPKMKWHSCDVSEQMVQYGKLSYPKAEWKVADVQNLDYPDAKFDLVFSSMVLIHLADPMKAMKEFYRILKPGGRLIITCPNDKTFEGPEVLIEMVEKHATIHPADRYVMEKLPGFAKELGLTQENHVDFIANNSGIDDKPKLEYPTIHLGMMTGWSMLSFMGHPKGMEDVYARCQAEYMSNRVQFKTKIQTYLYKK